MFMKQIEGKIAEAQRLHDKKASKKGARRRSRAKALLAVVPDPINGHEPEPEPEPNGPPEEPNGPPEEPNGPPEEPNGPPEEPKPAARIIGLKVPPEVREQLEQIKQARGLRTIKETALVALAEGAAALLQK